MITKMSKMKKSDIIIECVLIVIAAIFMIPVYYMIVTTFKTPQEATANPMGIPHSLTLQNYAAALKAMNYPQALFNTVFITLVTVAITIFVSSMAAYTIARRNNKLNKAIFLLFLAGMMIPFQMGLTSLYKLIKAIHLMNNPFSVILINSAGSCIAGIFLVKCFISTIPLEIEESAFMDGCSVFQVFYRIILPLLKPVIASMAIIVMLGSWNDFMNPLLFLQSRKKGVILLELARNVGQFSIDWTNLFPMLVLGILPLTIFYIFMQKYIIDGVAAGAVKG